MQPLYVATNQNRKQGSTSMAIHGSPRPTHHGEGLSGFWLTLSAVGWTTIIMLCLLFWWPLFVYVFNYWF
jgi:hypothetical protein